jgi:hypothetical protein
MQRGDEEVVAKEEQIDEEEIEKEDDVKSVYVSLY